MHLFHEISLGQQHLGRVDDYRLRVGVVLLVFCKGTGCARRAGGRFSALDYGDALLELEWLSLLVLLLSVFGTLVVALLLGLTIATA